MAKERIRRALGALQDLDFTLEDLAEASGLSPETLRHTPRCRQVIKDEAVRLGLEFVRGGRSGPGRFHKAI